MVYLLRGTTEWAYHYAQPMYKGLLTTQKFLDGVGVTKHIDGFAENIEKNKSKNQRFIADFKLNAQLVELHFITARTRPRFVIGAAKLL